MKIFETFINCPNFRRKKNANYTHKSLVATANCICGTILSKKVNKQFIVGNSEAAMVVAASSEAMAAEISEKLLPTLKNKTVTLLIK